jgi:tetraacyldisaccharide 4'-kinase
MRNPILAPFGWLYGSVIAVRNWIYDSGMIPLHSVSVPVIAVGNLTTGGSGKTPCALFTLQLFVDAGRRPALVSRGYGRKTKGTVIVSDGKSILVGVQESGDEAMLVARRFPNVIVVVSERRFDAAYAAMELGADCIVADDAFQHRSFFRELDIVMTGEELTNRAHYLLPAGNGREPLRSLRRADIIVSTAHAEAEVKQQASRRSEAPVVFADIVPTQVFDPRSGASESLDWLNGKKVVVFTGIARPERVSAALRQLGATVVSTRTFSDHHWFSSSELREVTKVALSSNAVLFTTEKDWVRLSAMAESSVILDTVELRIMRVELTIRHGGDLLASQILLQLHSSSGR